ncbi:MAG: DMT family transporter [Clostridiales bacterium]|nr:DMT family transporter [Clostridiales bacterium]
MIVIKLSKTACTACLFSTAIIWGLAFVAQRVGADYMSPFTFNGVRFMLGSVSLIPVILILERGQAADNKVTFWAGAGGGIILFLASSLQQFGVEMTGSAGKAGFLTGLYTVLVPMLGRFLGRKVRMLTWIGAVSAVIGLYLLSVPDWGSMEPGDIVLVIGAFFWAGHIIFIDRFVNRIKVISFSMIQFFTCGLLSVICAFLFENVTLAGINAGIIPLLYGGLLSAGVAYTLQSVGQKGVEPAKAAIILSLEAIFSAIGSAVILNERLSPRGYAGCAFIFAGIIASQINTTTTT